MYKVDPMLTAEERYAETLYITQNRAMEVLGELLEQATDPIERRRIATVIMRAQRPKPPAPAPKAPPKSPAPQKSPPSTNDEQPTAQPPELPDFSDSTNHHAPGDRLLQAQANLALAIQDAQRRQSSP